MTSFPTAFESAFGRLQVSIEEACGGQPSWALGVGAAVREVFEFAAVNAYEVDLLTNRALAAGPEGARRYRRLVSYVADLLRPGREEHPAASLLPDVLEQALAGGLAFLVAQRLDQGRGHELPGLAAEAIEFLLTPYLGPEEARRVAAT